MEYHIDNISINHIKCNNIWEDERWQSIRFYFITKMETIDEIKLTVRFHPETDHKTTY